MLCVAILRWLQRQWERDHQRLAPEIAAIMKFQEGDNDSTSRAKRIEVVGDVGAKTVSSVPGQPTASAKPTYDEHTGEILDPGLVRQSKCEKLAFFRKKGVCRVIARSRARGARFIGTRWVIWDVDNPDIPLQIGVSGGGYLR